MKLALRITLIYTGIVLGLVACDSTRPSATAGSRAIGTKTAKSNLQNEDSSNTTTTTTDIVKKLIPPGMAKVNLVDDGTTKPIDLGDTPMTNGVKVPILSFKREKADYVQIMRCPKSYTMRNTLGESIEHMGENPSDLDSKEWAWAQAISDARQCKIVSNFSIETKYADTMADSGEFYYVLNPCVTKETSGEAKNKCSFRLKKTDSIAFTESFRQEYRDKESELSAAQATLNAHLNRVYILASELSIAIKYCEDRIGADYQLQSFQSGLITIGAIAAGMAVDAFCSYCGGMGNMIVPIAVQMFLIPKLGINPSQLSTSACTGDPSEIQKMIDDPNNTQDKSQLRAAKKMAEQYSASYNIDKIARELIDLAGANPTGSEGYQGYDATKDCKIDQDQRKLQEIMAQLNAIDSRSLTLEQAAIKLGIPKDRGGALQKQLPKVPGGLDMNMLQSLLGGAGADTGK